MDAPDDTLGTHRGSLLHPDAVYLGTSFKTPDAGLQYLRLDRANRHGLVTGATGTGKTVTLQILAEGFSRAGVPSFAADIKGDLAGLSVAGTEKDFLEARAQAIGLTDYAYRATPTLFWDLFGEKGHPIRTTVSEMGPVMIAAFLELNDVQEGVLNIAFRVADEEGLPLLDLKDLRALMVYVADEASVLSKTYGLVSAASVGAIQRAILVLEQQGGNHFFGEPALKISDIMRTTVSGEGMASVLSADRLMQSPKLYAVFLLWLMSELFQTLPEVGDPDKPRLVFFFDEAHLLFDKAPKALLEKVEQVVRLIRSKGVGVIFVTQNPLDVPETVLGQLGNRIQHALRAYTPRDQRAVRAAAQTFRPNTALNTEQVITELAVGEALTSMLGKKGAPGVVQRTLIRPPSGRLGPISDAERAKILAASPLSGIYDQTVDRRSAYEMLAERAARASETPADELAHGSTAPPRCEPEQQTGILIRLWRFLFGVPRKRLSAHQKAARGAARSAAAEAGERIGRAMAGRTGARVGKSIARGAFGTLLKR